MTAWLAMMVAAVASSTMGSRAHCGTIRLKRIFDRGRCVEEKSTLAQIVDHQCWQHNKEPGGANGLFAEVTKVGIKCFSTCHGQKHCAKGYETDDAVIAEEDDSVDRIE